MKILITACQGVLGSYLAKKLELCGYQVVKTSRINMDVLHIEQVHRYLSNKWDVVIHCAAVGGLTLSEKDNGILYNNLLMFENLAKYHQNCRLFINFGSGAEFDRSQDINEVREIQKHTRLPKDSYGLAKNIISKRMDSINHAVHLRIFNCFSRREPPTRFISSAVKAKRYNQTLVVKNKYMDFFYIEDVFKTVMFYIKNINELQGLPQDVNLVYPNTIKLLDIARIIDDLDSGDRPFNIQYETPKQLNYCGNGDILQSLGISLTGLHSGLQSVYKEIGVL